MKAFQTGITFGSWDLLHPGHIAFLQSCSKTCDELIIGLHNNPDKERADKLGIVETLFERWIRLNALHLDCRRSIIPYTNEEDVAFMLETLSPNVRYLGEDYKDKVETITGYDLCVKRDISIQLISREHKLSTTRLKECIVSWGGLEDGTSKKVL